MKFLIITNTPHKLKDGKYYAYGPYIKEMNIWISHVEEVRVISFVSNEKINNIDLAYEHKNIEFISVPTFNLTSIVNIFKTLGVLPIIIYKLFKYMAWSNHIHLRSPSNMGLLGLIVQVFFPSKKKTVKYAGNWDPHSIQPKTYNLQKALISNTSLTKNTKALVYGEWENQTNNIVSFFTASYYELEKEEIEQKALDKTLNLLFVGSLSSGKRPMIALESLKILIDEAVDARLDILGEGKEREKLEKYIDKFSLRNYVTLHGNQNSKFVKEKYKQAHFLILMSKSEGWPKVVAEAMFWSCIPISSKVSCVEYMLGYGKRGKIVKPIPLEVVNEIKSYIDNINKYKSTYKNAMQWSRKYTLDTFSEEIKRLLNA